MELRLSGAGGLVLRMCLLGEARDGSAAAAAAVAWTAEAESGGGPEFPQTPDARSAPRGVTTALSLG